MQSRQASLEGTGEISMPRLVNTSPRKRYGARGTKLARPGQDAPWLYAPGYRSPTHPARLGQSLSLYVRLLQLAGRGCYQLHP